WKELGVGDIHGAMLWPGTFDLSGTATSSQPSSLLDFGKAPIHATFEVVVCARDPEDLRDPIRLTESVDLLIHPPGASRPPVGSGPGGPAKAIKPTPESTKPKAGLAIDVDHIELRLKGDASAPPTGATGKGAQQK
ncbi:MAG: hypothetical protein AAFQ53_11625, partial [Bacteroidota bacterium]